MSGATGQGGAFNFGNYPGIYGNGYGGGFYQPSFNYGNDFQSQMGNGSGYSNPVNPNQVGQPTSSLQWMMGQSPYTQQQTPLRPSYMPPPYMGGPGGEIRQNLMPPPSSAGAPVPPAPTPPSVTPPPAAPGSAPPGSSLNAAPKAMGDNFTGLSQGPITPIAQSYNPIGDGYSGMAGQYQIRQNPLIGQALNANPQAVFQLLGGGGGAAMDNYSNAANALQQAGFGGAGFNDAFRNLQQALAGSSVNAIAQQYRGLPSYFGGQ